MLYNNMTTYSTDHKSYYEKNKDRIKQYYLDNKERIIKRNSEYNSKHRDKISIYQYFYFQENKHRIYAKQFVHQYNYYYRKKEDGRASDIKKDQSKSTKPTNKKNQLSTVKIKTSDDIICKFN